MLAQCDGDDARLGSLYQSPPYQRLGDVTLSGASALHVCVFACLRACVHAQVCVCMCLQSGAFVAL